MFFKFHISEYDEKLWLENEPKPNKTVNVSYVPDGDVGIPIKAGNVVQPSVSSSV